MKYLPLLLCATVFAADITVDVSKGQKYIWPGLYGRNHGISNDATKPTEDSIVALYNDVGVRMLRSSGGNNQTKYNWRKKISSHPDWFNNVYAQNWDFSAQEIQSRLPNTMGLFSLQLIGWAASSTDFNFPDWNWYQEKGSYPPVGFDLAGEGQVSDDGKTLIAKGAPSLYVERWPADSTVGILNHWFSTLDLDKTRFQYWNMDNEPDIWNGTHNDVMPDTIPMDSFINAYIEVAKKARTAFPDIKLVGPVLTNEWQWWTWNGKAITSGGVKYTPMEYFLLRIGQAEKSSGMRLLDVYDVHWYPEYNDSSKINLQLQAHRVLWDSTYLWSGANGIHVHDGKWGTPTAYYLFKRLRQWMVKHLGDERGVGITEIGTLRGGTDPKVQAVTYASFLGSGADNGMELFTPWDWYDPWFEVLHLFSKHGGQFRVQSTSSIDTLVSAYSSLTADGDSLTVILVNRHRSAAQTANVTLPGFTPGTDSAVVLRASEGLKHDTTTFVSAAQNALVKSKVAVSATGFSLELPPLSVNAVKIPAQTAVELNVATMVQSPVRYRSCTLFCTSQGLSIQANAPGWVDLYSLNGTKLQRIHFQQAGHYSIPIAHQGMLLYTDSQGITGKVPVWPGR